MDGTSSNRTPKVLILFSNPADSARVRLDIEHREIDQVLKELSLDTSFVRRLHAVSVDDFASALQSDDFEVIQFSGHGCPDGIFLERGQIDNGVLVSSQQLAAILRRTSPKLRVLLLLSCFSSSSLGDLAIVAPYVITIAGQVDDEACIKFVSGFYSAYFKNPSVEWAFNVANDLIEYGGYSERIHPVLTRRATIGREARAFCAATIRGGDSVLIDLSKVEGQINSLGIPREAFLSLLSRKISIHRFFFAYPHDRTILSIGPYFDVFGWKNVDDPVVCYSIMRVSDQADEDACETWADLLVSYNDCCSNKYRIAPNPAAPNLEPYLKNALKDLKRVARNYFKGAKQAKILRRITPEQFKLSKSLVLSNLRHADVALGRGDLPRLLAYIEASLTAVHDLVDALARVLTKGIVLK